MKRRLVLWGLAAITVVLDQVTKIAVFKALAVGTREALVPGLLWLTPRLNRGAAFSLLEDAAGGRYLLLAISGALLVILLYLSARTYRGAPAWTFGLVVGGALSNMIDRAVGYQLDGERYYAVRDFVDLRWYPAVFNLADTAIVAGILALLYWSFFRAERHRARPDDPA